VLVTHSLWIQPYRRKPSHIKSVINRLCARTLSVAGGHCLWYNIWFCVTNIWGASTLHKISLHSVNEIFGAVSPIEKYCQNITKMYYSEIKKYNTNVLDIFCMDMLFNSNSALNDILRMFKSV
jgi:hypothetical protein